MTLEKQTFTCDQTNERFEKVFEGVLTIDNTRQVVITPIKKPKIFPWDEVSDGVLVCIDSPKNDHFLFNCKHHSTELLRLSNEWQNWMSDSLCPIPGIVMIEVILADGKKMEGLAKKFTWKLENYQGNEFWAGKRIVAFRVLNIGDYKYPDEV